MGSKRRYRRQLRVQTKYAATHGGDERLSRAIDILLKAATSDALHSKESPNAKKEEPSGQVPTKDTLTGGGEDSDRQGS